jgi:hypothetical protein
VGRGEFAGGEEEGGEAGEGDAGEVDEAVVTVAGGVWSSPGGGAEGAGEASWPSA